MRITITGATGLIGSRLVRELRRRGDDVTVLSRNPGKAKEALRGRGPGRGPPARAPPPGKAKEALGVEAAAWDPQSGPAPPDALEGRDAVVHLAGENVAQRWSDDA